ncbi:peptidoglycan D,D-transpeptidase FtsI family protein, partial [Patescibacteria group bacterium]
VVNGEEYRDKADGQYITPASNVFDRGSIFFSRRDKMPFSAAGLDFGYIIAINPQKIKDAENMYEQISSTIQIDKEDFIAKANKANDPYEEIVLRVPEKDALEISNLDLEGLSIHKHKWRFYPAGRTAAHTLGFVAYKDNDLIGRYGLEHYYEDVLSRAENDLYVNFFAEIFSNITDSILVSDNSREGDIVLSIELDVQTELENVLSGIEDKWYTSATGGIIMDPRDGSIYAMAATPNFDPNNFSEENDSAVFSNPLVESVFEMGSIVKPLTMAAALDSGAVTAKTTYNDKGYVVLDTARIENFDGKARGVVSMQEVLNQSLNTGMVFVMQEMGKDVFRDYMLSYGIGDETGVDLPGEIHGLVDNLNSTRDIEYATAAFGQGIAMTPISITRSLATLANGGHLVTPYLVKRINYETGLDKKIYPDEGERIISGSASEEITRMLVEVVDEALLNGDVALPRYSIAAKTGTAQIADMENGGYYEDRYLHSFFGYFPAYDPQFIIFLYDVNPKGARYASQTLTHPFMDLTKFLINHYEIEPDR